MLVLSLSSPFPRLWLLVHGLALAPVAGSVVWVLLSIPPSLGLVGGVVGVVCASCLDPGYLMVCSLGSCVWFPGCLVYGSLVVSCLEPACLLVGPKVFPV